jgi:hypothetical protein
MMKLRKSGKIEAQEDTHSANAATKALSFSKQKPIFL